MIACLLGSIGGGHFFFISKVARKECISLEYIKTNHAYCVLQI